MNWSNLAKFKAAKFYVAASAVLVMLGQAMSDGTVTNDEWTKLALAGAGALLVYFAPNKPAQPAGPPF